MDPPTRLLLARLPALSLTFTVHLLSGQKRAQASDKQE